MCVEDTVQEFRNDISVDWDPDLSIAGLLRKKADERPQHIQWERKSALGSSWVPVTVSQFLEEVRHVAAGLAASGINPGDRVAILAGTSYEFSQLDFGLWWIGAIPIAIYQTDSPTQIEHILDDSEISFAITETAAQADLLRDLSSSRPRVREVLVLEGGAMAELGRRGEARPELAEEVERRSLATRGNDLATIIYTSGTTGKPKGVALRHRNFIFITSSGRLGFPEVVDLNRPRTLLFLPLAHVFARFIEVLAVATNTVLGHCPDTKNLVADMATFKPTYLLTAPRVLETVYNAADQKAGGGVKQRIFRWSAKAAIGHSRAEEAGGASLYLKAKRSAAEKLVLKKIAAVMGGNLRFIVSGGAPLSPRMGHFFRGAGFTVMEGYGLSETTAPLSVNPSSDTRIGTVGVPFPAVAVRISDEGEIQVKGDLVFEGYHSDPDATAEAFTDDHWFKTGDLGTLTEDGYITITGRAKEIIVTAGGKNVAPNLLEDRLRGHPLVSQAVVVGDGKPFIGALITLDADRLPSWLESHGMEPLTVVQAARDERVLAALDATVARANEAVSRAESIRKFTVLTEDFTEENGLLTPSMKVKRTAVIRRFARDVAEIYGEDPEATE